VGKNAWVKIKIRGGGFFRIDQQFAHVVYAEMLPYCIDLSDFMKQLPGNLSSLLFYPSRELIYNSFFKFVYVCVCVRERESVCVSHIRNLSSNLRRNQEIGGIWRSWASGLRRLWLLLCS